MSYVRIRIRLAKMRATAKLLSHFSKQTIIPKEKRYAANSMTMNSSAHASPTIVGTEASSQPPSLAPSPALDVDMTAVSSVSLGAGAAGSTAEMYVEDTGIANSNSDQQFLLHRTLASRSTFNPAAWTGQIIGSTGGGGGDQPPPPAPAAANNAMAQNDQPFSTPSLIRVGPRLADADSNHLLRSATLYASPDLAALTAIAATTATTAAPATFNDNVQAASTPLTMTMNAAAAANNNMIMAAAGYGYGFGYGYGYPSFPPAFTPSAASATSATVPATVDGRIVGAAMSRDDLPPTGTTPPLPSPLPMPASTHHRRHPGMFAGTPLASFGDGISRSFFTPGGNFVDLPSVNNNTAVTSTTSSASTADTVGASNPFGFWIAANVTSAVGQQQGQGQLNHPGAPVPSLTVAAINAAQMQVQTPTGLQMAAMAAAANADGNANNNVDPTTAKASAKKRGGNTAGTGTKTKKAKTTKKPRPLPTSSNRPARTATAAATTVSVGTGNSSGRYGSARVSHGASRPFTQDEKDATRCSCKKSRCLQLYCDCFQSGSTCKDDCRCKSCGNTTSNRKRQEIIDDILARRPEAFMLRAAPETGVGCRCKKSKCLKLYCACFKAGNHCGEECICTDCANTGEKRDEDSKPAAAESVATLETVVPAPEPITPRDPPQMQSMEPAMAADTVDVTPDSTYQPIISEHAAV